MLRDNVDLSQKAGELSTSWSESWTQDFLVGVIVADISGFSEIDASASMLNGC
jgi:hypothetical protein